MRNKLSDIERLSYLFDCETESNFQEKNIGKT